MQLTGQQIALRKIVSNYCEEGIQQQGLDVRVKDISKVTDEVFGVIPKEGKTIKCKTGLCYESETGYILHPGYYEVTFMEGCKIPNNLVMNFRTRSSLVRCGATVHSGQFDGGFQTGNMGCFLEVRLPIVIEKGARIAQAVFTETYEVAKENLYNGQWQNDKQR